VKASYTLGVVAGDVDGDGDVDLYVANDSEANYLFVNRGPGGDGHRFEESAMLFGVDMNEDGRPQAGMGVELADVDDDGLFDLFVTNFSHDSNSLYHAFRTPSGGTMFSDATYAMDLGRSSYDRLSWGTCAVDLDLDGRQDLVVVSGHVYPQVDDAPVGSSYRQRNQVFVNRGPQKDGGPVRFEELVPAAGDAFELARVSRGLVAADLDEDGDVDLFVVELDEAPTLIRNDCARNGAWVGFLLVGAGANRDAIGAVIEAEDARGRVRLRMRASGASYLSSGDPRLHLGLGDARGALPRVSVRWPSGQVDVHEGLAVERYWVLDEGGAAR
jgi:enediyne biosynthesis protein E4